MCSHERHLLKFVGTRWVCGQTAAGRLPHLSADHFVLQALEGIDHKQQVRGLLVLGQLRLALRQAQGQHAREKGGKHLLQDACSRQTRV